MFSRQEIYILKYILIIDLIPETQFFRVLWENLSLKLDDEEQRILAEKYDLKRDGRLNYRAFCNVIERPFNPNNLTCPPGEQRIEVPEL